MPSAWVTLAFYHGAVLWLLEKTWAYGLLTVPALLTAALPWAMLRLRAIYEADQQLPRGDSSTSLMSERADSTTNGLIERTVALLMRVDDPVVLNAIKAQRGAWTRHWVLGSMIALGGSLLCLALPGQALAVHCLLAGSALALGLPVLGGHWPTFDADPLTGICRMSEPANDSEFGRLFLLMVVANLVRCTCWLPAAAGYAAALSLQLGGSATTGALIAAKLVLAVVAVQPLLGIMRVRAVSCLQSRLSRPVPVAIVLLFSVFIFMVAVGYRDVHSLVSWGLGDSVVHMTVLSYYAAAIGLLAAGRREKRNLQNGEGR